MSIFSIGLSGLTAARNAFNTTSNNISNVYTPGYNREIAVLDENAGGQGVHVADIQRQFNHFVASQLNSATSRTKALDAYQGQIKQIDDLLADEDAGLAPLMQQFFGSVADLTASPSDPAARQGVIGSADTLAAQFRSFDSYLNDMGTNVDGQVKEGIKQINNKTKQIAQINKQIALAKAKHGKAPNSMLDQRDQMVADLNEHLEVHVIETGSGNYNVSLGNGHPLVAGDRQFKLTTTTSSADPTRLSVAYIDPAGNSVEMDDSVFTGGRLGGLLQFRDETLLPTRNRLGQLAANFAVNINKVHENGVDLNGDDGEAMFSVGAPRVFANDKNAGSPGSDNAITDVQFDPDNINQLTTSDYSMQWDGTSSKFVVTRLDTGEPLSNPGDVTVTSGPPDTYAFGGITMQVDTMNLQDGDTFQIQPTRVVAKEFENAIHESDKIAASSQSNPGAGNNENALDLQNLQNASLIGGHASFNQAYASMVSDIGSKTNIVGVNLDAQQGLTDQLTQVQQSESGVNLDEEAANLMRYQQFYQANARVIQTGSTILDTILSLG